MIIKIGPMISNGQIIASYTLATIPLQDENKGAAGYFKARMLFLSTAILVTLWSAYAAAQTAIVASLPVVQESAPATASLAERSEAASQSADELVDERPFHIPLILNDSVENEIAYFTTRGRNMFQHWLDSSARYLMVMKKILQEHNLPEDLAYLAMIESGFDPHAVSRKKAIGPWQFMIATGRKYGLSVDQWVDERRDPVKSTRAAATYLRDLHNLFGSWPLALASYNAGTTKVLRAVLLARSEDFWDLRASRQIRKETRNYVPRYMAALIIAKDPRAYGFTVPETEAYEFDEVIVRESTDLRQIARYARCSYEDIRELNPELIQGATPPKIRYLLRLPPGTKSAYKAGVAKSLREEKFRQERIEAMRRRLPFSKLIATPPVKIFDPTCPVNIVPRFGVQVGFSGDITCAEGGMIPRSRD